MSYAERADTAQQEQLDWLHQIYEESRTQTELLSRIARHTGLIYALAIVWLVGVVVYLVTLLAR